jgi:dolichol-phosphate mannosyltransferase
MSNKNNPTVNFENNSKKISVVVPVYCNQETVRETCQKILEIKIQQFNFLELEIIFVDDGSSDGSWQELTNLRAENPGVVSLVKLSRNFGQVSAILAGYATAQGDAIITISADLQDPVSVMVQMIAHWERGQEIVIAHREARNDDITATLFSKMAYGFARKANPRMPEGGFDYLLMSKRAIEVINSFSGRHRFFQGDVLWIGLPTAFIPYTRERRPRGKSRWTFKKKIKYGIDLVLDSSYLPIRMMSASGFITAASGILYTIVIVISWLRGNTPFEGWAPLMILITIIGGLIMMMLGVIGEYIWRIHDDIKNRPLYVIEKQFSSSSSLQEKS